MNITLTGTKVSLDTHTLAFAKNNLVNEIICTVDTDESWTYRIDVLYSQTDCSGNPLYNIINLNRVGNVCSALLTIAMLPFSGKYTMQLRGIKDQQIYHSDIFEVWVKYSIDPSNVYDPVPSEFYQIEDNIIEINNHPPYPDISGFWMIWNPTADWTPDITPAMFVVVSPDEWPEFVQPTGAHDAYKKGDKVTFEGKHYISLIDGNVYSPTAYPAGWQEQT